MCICHSHPPLRSLLSNSPPTPRPRFLYPLIGSPTPGLFPLLPVVGSAVWTLVCAFSCGHCFLFFGVSVCLGVELRKHMVFSFGGAVKPLSPELDHFIFSPAMGGPLSPRPHQRLFFSVPFFFQYLFCRGPTWCEACTCGRGRGSGDTEAPAALAEPRGPRLKTVAPVARGVKEESRGPMCVRGTSGKTPAEAPFLLWPAPHLCPLPALASLERAMVKVPSALALPAEKSLPCFPSAHTACSFRAESSSLQIMGQRPRPDEETEAQSGE